MAKRTITTCDLCGSPEVAGRVEVFVDGAIINVSVDLCGRDLRDAVQRYASATDAGVNRVGEALDKKAKGPSAPATPIAEKPLTKAGE